MKYIITENRLDTVIFKFLDTNYGALEQKKGKYVDIVFHFPGEEFGVLGWEKSGVLHVYYKLSDEISDKNINSDYWPMQTLVEFKTDIAVNRYLLDRSKS